MILPREGRAKPSHPVEPGDTNESEGPAALRSAGQKAS